MASDRITAYRSLLAVSSVLGAAAVGLGGCSDNVSGDLEAQAFGDLSNPPAVRADGYREIGARCDGAAAAVSAEVRRRPYLQRLTSTSARLLWTTAVDEE